MTTTLAPADRFAALWPDVQRYTGRVAAVMARRTGLDRDDLFSAGTMAVWKAVRRGTFDGVDCPQRLANCVAKRGVLTAVTREMPHVRRACRLSGGLLGELVTAPQPVEPADPPAFDTLLRFAVPADRELLEWRFRDGQTQQEIAERLGVTRAAIGQRLERALRRVRDGIERDGRGIAEAFALAT